MGTTAEIQFLQATYLRHGYKKVEPRILDDTLHHSLLVCSSHPAKMLTKQIMAYVAAHSSPLLLATFSVGRVLWLERVIGLLVCEATVVGPRDVRRKEKRQSGKAKGGRLNAKTSEASLESASRNVVPKRGAGRVLGSIAAWG